MDWRDFIAYGVYIFASTKPGGKKGRNERVFASAEQYL